jgi:CMP-N,N'-diacetyllegionaminic acid synthase
MRKRPVPRVLAIVPARGGSRGLPRKNVLPLAGIPLVARTILAARGCPHIDACVLTTDDPKIRAIGLDYRADVIDRPAELADDLATSQAVVRHALEALASAGRLPEYFVLLQPTSPLRAGPHITACIEAFFRCDAQSAISVTEAKESPFKAFVEKNGSLEPLFDVEALHAPRQTLPRVYNQNGAIYLTSSAAFLRTNRFFIPPVMPFVMDAAASVDIDTALDWRIAECLISG